MRHWKWFLIVFAFGCPSAETPAVDSSVGTDARVDGSTNDSGVTDGGTDGSVDACTTNPCMNGGSCSSLNGAISCECADGFEGDRCQTNTDECAPNPCSNGGTCTDEANGYTCACAAGYSGATCGVNVDDCAATPCENGGTCTDGVNSFTCECPAGYSGNTCSGNIDDCEPNPCMNGATCADGVNGYTCTCAAGYTGATCDVDVNDCAENPCMNGGTCSDGVNSYSCSCPAGYDGSQCQNNIDECVAMPCMNGGTCADGVNSRSCECADGYGGLSCETVTALRDCAAILAENPSSESGVYPIAPDGTTVVSTFCDMTTDGGGWSQILDQDWARFGAVRPREAWISANPTMPNAGDYSILSHLPNLGNETGYEMRYEWLDGPMPAGSLQWVQNRSPLVVGDTAGRANISLLATTLPVYPGTECNNAPFSGLGMSDSGALLDGDHGGCWWFAAGTAASHASGVDGIPTYSVPHADEGNSARHVKVWVRPGRVAPRSCQEIFTRNPEATNGAYYVDPDGMGGANAFSVECDMTTDGGGWTVISREDFQSGATGWSNSATSSACAYATTTLGGYNLFGGGAASQKSFALLGIPHTTVRIQGNYYSFDSWDGEQGIVQADGVDVLRQVFWYTGGTNRCGGGWNDRDAFAFGGNVGHTGNSVIVRATSTLDQVPNDESWAIDDVAVLVR